MNSKLRHAIFVSTMTLGTMGTLALTACSDSDDSSPNAVNEQQMELESIAALATEDGRFTTLLTALTEADLAATFAAEGSYTVFAPTDAAFEALPEGVLEALLADKDLLTQVLQYHVVGSSVLAADVVGLDKATTLESSDISISLVDDGVVLNGSVNVLETDLVASNGVIHVIDGVLLPEGFEIPANENNEEKKDDEESEGPTQTITEIAAADSNFSTLVAALQDVGLDEVLNGTDKYTVFAPTNAAFDALPEGTVEALLDGPDADLTEVLLNHVVAGKVDAETVVTLNNAKTVDGARISIEVVDGGVVINGTVKVTTTDIMATNGIIHVIDAVILPAGNIVETAVAAGSFTTLVGALESTELDGVLANEENFYTVFAPTDDAFAKLPEGLISGLSAEELKTVLLSHVVEGDQAAEGVVKESSFTTVSGEEIKIVIDGETITIGGATLATTDIFTSNGVIHVIEDVIVPTSVLTITQIAAGDDDFSTLVAALQDVGLDETLNGEDEYTVFAPTNAAFDKLAEGTVQSLLDGPDADLIEVLLNHVVAGTVKAETVVGLTNAKTVDGARVSIEVVDGEVIIDGSIKVTATDIVAKNGVIHVIDAVILPKGNIVETAVDAGTFTQLADALVSTGLDAALSDEEKFYTVFAPTDDAFAKIQSTVDGLTTEELTAVLKAHVVEANADAVAVLAESSHTTIGGEVIDVVVDGNTITIGGATLSTTDIFTSNGVIHVLDDVIVP